LKVFKCHNWCISIRWSSWHITTGVTPDQSTTLFWFGCLIASLR
jgi:hypothetical protein